MGGGQQFTGGTNLQRGATIYKGGATIYIGGGQQFASASVAQQLQTEPLQLRIRPRGFRTLPGAASIAAALARRGAAAPHGGDPWPTVDAGIRRLRTGWGLGRGGRGEGGL